MLKQYFKQAWRLLSESPVLSAISIMGTALAICMIMVMVMSHEVKNAPFAPETKRSRTLYQKWITSELKNGDNTTSNNGTMSLAIAKECFKALKTPEAVAVVSPFGSALASMPDVKKAVSFDKMGTDEAFWQVFNFSFISGQPYTKADVDAGLRKAVIAESVARAVFGDTQAVGKTILLDYTGYVVTGVVRDVSTLASSAYSQIWIPYSSEDREYMVPDQIMGIFRVYILAHSPNDFAAIREEAEQLRKKYNEGLTDGTQALYNYQPDAQFTYNNRKWANVTPDMKKIVTQYIIVIALLLLVPAINLSGMTGSRMRKRLSELGVRRAFGATRRNLFLQILWESLLQTLLGGLLGMVLSCLAAYIFKGMIYLNTTNAYLSGDTSIDLGALLNPTIFLYAFLFCILLNALSAGIPAWRTSRSEIVNSIHSK